MYKLNECCNLSSFQTTDIQQKRVFTILNSFFLVGFISFFLFIFINLFIVNNYIVAFADASMFFFLTFVYIDFRKNNNFLRTSFILLFIFTVFLFVLVFVNHHYNYGYIWSVFFPLLALPLLGAKRGIQLTVVYYLVFFSVLFLGLELFADEGWNFTSFIRILIASIMITFILYSTEKSLEMMHDELEKRSMHDSLTRLYNRRKIDIQVTDILNSYIRYKTPFSIAIIDLDDFKNVNDTYGHAVGDDILIKMSELLLNNFRKTDFIGRWGGEEFIVLMQNTTLVDAKKGLLSFKNAVESYDFGEVGRVTCSIGVCEVNEEIVDENSLFICADKALYVAKNSGKNCIATADGELIK